MQFLSWLPPFLPLVPGFIEVVVAAVLVEILRVAVVLAETVPTARTNVGTATTVIEGLEQLRFLLLLLGKAGGALCIDLLLLCNFPRQRTPECGDLLRKFTVVVRGYRLQRFQRPAV